VKVPGSNFAWALRQARDYVLSESILGMVLACFVYPAPSDRHGSRYLEGMAKLAFYDRVGTAYDFNGLCLSFGGHVVFRQGEWTSQANRFLFGTRQFGGGRSDDWRKDRFIRRI